MPFQSLFIIFWRLMKVCIRFWKSWENFKIVLNLDCFNNFSWVMTSSDGNISCLAASQSFKWNDVQMSWDKCILQPTYESQGKVQRFLSHLPHFVVFTLTDHSIWLKYYVALPPPQTSYCHKKIIYAKECPCCVYWMFPLFDQRLIKTV